jgi:hypothetical protein
VTLLDNIVTPAFVAFQAHCWFAYAVVFTFFNPWVVGGAVVAAGVKEFYIDKHFESDQSFKDNAQDFVGYAVGVVLAVLARVYL